MVTNVQFHIHYQLARSLISNQEAYLRCCSIDDRQNGRIKIPTYFNSHHNRSITLALSRSIKVNAALMACGCVEKFLGSKEFLFDIS
jgi:hypothetical protein